MNFKKILAGVAAGAMAVSALSVSAFALLIGENVSEDGKQYLVDVVNILPEGVDISEVYGASIYFKDGYSMEDGQGGGFIFSTKSNNWHTIEWGNEGSDKPIVLDEETDSITRMEEKPFFTAVDISGNEGEYAQIALQQWWGKDIEIVKTVLLDKDGKELTAKIDEPIVTEPETTEPEANEPELEYVPVEIKGNEKHDAPVLNIDGGVRLNIVHPWSDGEYVFADYKAFAGAKTIKAVISVEGMSAKAAIEPFTASLMGMSCDEDKENGTPNSFNIWGNADDIGTANTVTVDKDGEYVLTLEAVKEIVENENFFLMVSTSIAPVKDAEGNDVVPEGISISLKSLEVGVEKTDAPIVTDPEATEPEATDPEATEPEATDPEATEPEATDPEAETTTGVAGNTNNGSDDKGGPATGVALAVIPAALAAAGVIIAKKRK